MYAQVWDETYPPGSLSADQIDNAIQYWAKAVRERMNSIMGITDWATAVDPITWGSIVFRGSAPSIQGGTTGLFFLDSTNTFINGLLSDSGDYTARRNLISTLNVISNTSFVCNAANGKFLPGTTTYSFRDFLDTVDNWLLYNNGNGVLRGTFSATGAVITGPGTIVRYDGGNSGAAVTFDFADGNNQKVVLTANCAIAIANAVAGSWITLELVQDGVGNRIVTWDAAIHWPSGTAPVLSTTPNHTDIVAFYYNGTNYLGATGGFNYV